MAMRMVPIGQTFQKMRRLVRDVAKKAGKQVELTITGEETELDKNVIQQISDPLVHMVRNAVDHGVESPEDRRRAGKPDAGQVLLNAFHQGDSIVIEVRDDGKGLDPERLRTKGIERGLIGPDDQLTRQQIFALILQPGFSTAEKVTDISGRGVGMDVVKRNVEQLRGKIDIESEPGRGSTFYIRLPLTLAIIDGMLVRVGRERMIIPTILIEQSLRPEPRQITTVQKRGAMLQVRGELCPLIQLGPLFGYSEPVDPCENLVVIVQCEAQKIALVLDELIGQQQVVIKTLGQRFKKVEGVSGAAILGDGRVGLILEPTGLLKLHGLRGTSVFQSNGAANFEPEVCDAADAQGEPQESCPAEMIAAPA
jgi:two-component system chemotaxis sensor kinase CheA